MSDKAKESGPQTEEQGALPAPNASQAAGDSGASGSTPTGDALRETLEPIVNDLVARAFQSQKDRGINQVRNEVKELSGALELLKSVVPEDVLQPYADKIEGVELRNQVQALAQRLDQQKTEPQPAGKPDVEQYQKSVQDIFSKSGLVEPGQDVLNSPAFLEFYKAKSGKFESLDVLVEAAEFVAGKLVTKKPIPAAAGGHSPSEEVNTNDNPITNVTDTTQLLKMHQELRVK